MSKNGDIYITEDSSKPADVLVKSPKQITMPALGAVVFESRHAPGFSGDLKDDYAKFHLVIAGHALWESGGEGYSIGPGVLFHIAAGVPHRQNDLPNDPVTLYAIHYRPETLMPSCYDELSELGMLPLDLHSANINQARQVHSIFQEMLFEQTARQTGWETMVRARLMDLAVLSLRLTQRIKKGTPVIRQTSASAERVANYALRLKSQFYLQETLDEAAHSIDLSRRQFTELFRKETGQTWRKHVLQLRMEHAVKLLTGTEKSVTAVAFECGFDDLSHFHHSFRSVYSQTPLAYRQKHRPKNQF